MSKDKGPEPAPYEEYMEQLNWRRRWQRRNWIPSRGDPQEPNWRYKISRPGHHPPTTGEKGWQTINAVVLVIMAFGISLILAQTDLAHINFGPGAICAVSAGLGAIFIIWLANRSIENINSRKKRFAKIESDTLSNQDQRHRH